MEERDYYIDEMGRKIVTHSDNQEFEIDSDISDVEDNSLLCYIKADG